MGHSGGVPVDEGGGFLVSQYLNDLTRRNYSPNTVVQRRRALARFRRWAGVAPEHAATAQLVTFLDRIPNPASRGSERANLAGFFRWLVLEELRVDDPMARVPKPRTKRWIPHPIPEEDLQRALALAPDRVRPWLVLAAYAGLRACEIAGLRGEDLWWHDDPPLVVVEHGKGDDPGAVPMAPILEKELHGMPRRGWLFTRMDDQPGPIPAHLVSHLANDFLHSIHIWHTLHSLRHRFGTQVLRASGGDLRQTQELLRHRSIASTTVYTEIDKSESAGIVAALPT